MAALVILATGIVFVLGSFSKIISGARVERDYIIALNLLENKIWETGRRGELDEGLVLGEESGRFPELDEKYRFLVEASETDLADSLAKVEYAVDWETDGTKRTIRIFGLEKKQ